MILLVIVLIIELVWSPRLDYAHNNNLLLWYNAGNCSKFNIRKFYKIF